MFEIRQLTGQEYVDRYAKRHEVVGGAEVAMVQQTESTQATPSVTSAA